MSYRRSLLPMIAASAVMAALAGCATPPKPMELTNTLEARATVTQLDVATRLMTLRGPAGNEFTFEAGNLSNGSYFYTLSNKNGKAVRQMVIAR